MSIFFSNFARKMGTDKQLHITNDSIFATGVFLKPCEIEIDGKKQWRWVATSFEDESFQNGQPLDVNTYASTLRDLYTPKIE